MEFVEAQCTITASASEGGSISPSGSISVAKGSSYAVSFSADEGYYVDTVTVNGTTVSATSSYTFNNITSDKSISVQFAEGEKEILYYVVGTSLNNSVFYTPASMTVLPGESATIVGEANSGYYITEVKVNVTTYKVYDEKTYTFTITLTDINTDISIYAVTAPISSVCITPYYYEVTLTAGIGKDIGVIVWNANEDNPVRVKMYDSELRSDKNQEVSYTVLSELTQWSAGYNDVGSGDSVQFSIGLFASEYSSGGSARLLLYFVVSENPDAEGDIAGEAILQAVMINITILPAMSMVEEYGLFLGIFENPFSDPLDTSTVMAILSLILLLVIVAVVLGKGYPVLKNWMIRKKYSPGFRTSVGQGVGAVVMIALIYIVVKCIFINGSSFRILAYTTMLSNAFYVLFIAAIALLTVREVKKYVLSRYSKDGSLLPLAFGLSQVAIVLASITLACEALGADILYIVAALGIATTALGFGFKATLTRILTVSLSQVRGSSSPWTSSAWPAVPMF